MKSATPKKSPEQKLFQGLMLSLFILSLCNLLLTASIVGLVGTILILVMVWGIRRGDYPLTKGLAVFLFLYGGSNLVVCLITILSGAEFRASALIWLAVYSALLIAVGVLLLGKKLQAYLKTAPQPEEKEHKINFFHGGWRDL